MERGTGGTGLSNFSLGLVQGVMAKINAERAMQELEMRVALPQLIQERRDAKERKARMDELRVRYDEEAKANAYQRETTLMAKQMDITQRERENVRDAWVQLNKPKGDQGKSVSLTEAQSVTSGVEKRFQKRFPKNWDKQQGLVESLQEYKAIPDARRKAMIDKKEITPPQFESFVAQDRIPRRGDSAPLNPFMGGYDIPYSDQEYLLGAGFSPADFAQGAAVESVLNDLNLEMLPGVLAGGTEESVLKATGQLADQWGDSVDVRTARNMAGWNQPVAPDTLIAPVSQLDAENQKLMKAAGW